MEVKAVSRLLRVRRWKNANFPVWARHGLAGADFCGFAAFRMAVNRDFAIGDHELGLATAVHDPGKFEQIAKCDMLAAQLEFGGVHNQLTPWLAR